MMTKVFVVFLVSSFAALALAQELGEGLPKEQQLRPNVLFDQHGQVLPDDPNSPDVNWSKLGKEGNSQWRAVGMLKTSGGTCSTTVFQIPQCNDPKRKAQILTNGHCVSTDMSVDFDMFHNMSAQDRVKAKVSKTVYNSFNRMDVAILELDQSYGELKQKGIEAKRIAKAPLQKDKKYDLVGVPTAGLKSPPSVYKSQCDISGPVSLVNQYQYWPDAVGFTGCSSVPGSSGSGLFRNNEIVGILNSGNFASDSKNKQPCYLGTCTHNSGAEPELQMMNFGFDVTGLHKCYKNCTLDTSLPECPLPDPNSEIGITPDGNSSALNWTSTLNRGYLLNSNFKEHQIKVCVPSDKACDCKDPSGYSKMKETTYVEGVAHSGHLFRPSQYLPGVPVFAKMGEAPNFYLFCFRGVKADGRLDDIKNVTSYPIYHYSEPKKNFPLKPLSPSSGKGRR